MLAYYEYGGLLAYPELVLSQRIGAGLESECRSYESVGHFCAVLGQLVGYPSGRL